MLEYLLIGEITKPQGVHGEGGQAGIFHRHRNKAMLAKLPQTVVLRGSKLSQIRRGQSSQAPQGVIVRTQGRIGLASPDQPLHRPCGGGGIQLFVSRGVPSFPTMLLYHIFDRST